MPSVQLCEKSLVSGVSECTAPIASRRDDLPHEERIEKWSAAVGCLLAHLPAYCTTPPIEVVVFGWGVTEDGQLGLDSKADVPRPSVIESLLGTSFSGMEFTRQPLVAGSRHTMAVTEDGRVLSCGWNDRGTLGLGHRHTTTKPTVIQALEHEHVVQVAAGGWHCLAVSDGGQIYAWGGNEYFQCGVDGGTRDITIPKPTVPFLRARMVSCGGMHSVALTEGGEVWQWGEPWGDFSLGSNRAPRKLDASNVVCIASGAFHNLALTSAADVIAWGTNDFGQLGTGDTVYAPQPRGVVGLNTVPIADISAGGWHSLALSAEGEVFTWGRGEYGRLGLNEPKGCSHVRPGRVPALKGHRVISARCGGSHTVALTEEGHMFTWGRGSNGRQGFETPGTVELPHEVSLPGGAGRWHPICIDAGGRHTMCMALPRQTVDDHERRLTQASSGDGGSWPARLARVVHSAARTTSPRAIGQPHPASSRNADGSPISRSVGDPPGMRSGISMALSDALSGSLHSTVRVARAERPSFMRKTTQSEERHTSGEGEASSVRGGPSVEACGTSAGGNTAIAASSGGQAEAEASEAQECQDTGPAPGGSADASIDLDHIHMSTQGSTPRMGGCDDGFDNNLRALGCSLAGLEHRRERLEAAAGGSGAPRSKLRPLASERHAFEAATDDGDDEVGALTHALGSERHAFEAATDEGDDEVDVLTHALSSGLGGRGSVLRDTGEDDGDDDGDISPTLRSSAVGSSGHNLAHS